MGVSYRDARSFYGMVKEWLEGEGERLGRAAVERHPRAVAKIVHGAQQVRQAETELRRIQQTKEVTPAVEPTRDVQEWEVTLKYRVGARGKHHGETVDITLRLVGRPGDTFTAAQVRAAAWYAMKHGAGSLTELTLHGHDWYSTRRSGTVEEYHYAADDEAALENARGLFHTVGIGGLRVALVE